ncbi:SDR family oxidoreductase [Chitinophaga nivalis]|uniref:SDR family oxidoreductase n=1 Tax=Chitinophaga nivalis TaxID=2991709 RepID=A0ABT3IKN6_9BACT|nr:SDR family oxidoreductase [Chitinophaga nivalis]MCW3465780.1 SDR family oxidoreductase [Chitinophaga nivalis]MCW3484529.1 SDR family oxidoreductase [Chitinophaga nivalis]
MSNKILITGVTGSVGKALTKSLQARQVAFKAASRNVAAAKEKLGLQEEVVHFSFDDPATFEAATADVEKVFLLGPSFNPHLDQLMTPFVAYLGKKGIKRIVYLSGLGLSGPVGLLGFHARMEQKLIQEGFDYTIIRPSYFAQNFRNYEYENITERSVVFAPAGKGKTAFIDVADIAAVATEVLTKEGHSGQAYELTGPEALSFYEVAALLTRFTGKQITYPEPDEDTFKAGLKATGVSDLIGEYMAIIYNNIANNKVAFTTDTIEKITGKKPTALETVLEQDWG